MPFIPEILKYDSLSIVGLEKNTGKTECLNYILGRLPLDSIKIAVTSIGIDGEDKDQVTGSAKPNIILREGVYFSTSENYYRQKNLSAELVDVSDEESSLGRIVTGKVIREGKILLAGPSSTISLHHWMNKMDEFGVNLKIVDGALNRLSLASPAISKAMILSTGAAYSAEMNVLVNKTKYMVDLINLSEEEDLLIKSMEEYENGIWGMTMEGRILNISKKSSLILRDMNSDFLKQCKIIYVAGALTDSFLNILINYPDIKGKELIVDDFTKIFTSEQAYRLFIKRGGIIKVMKKSKLIAVCVNPTAPNGYILDSDILCRKLEEAIKLPVYDIVKNNYC